MKHGQTIAELGRVARELDRGASGPLDPDRRRRALLAALLARRAATGHKGGAAA